MKKQIDLSPITVSCHSGYKAEEYPTSFYWDKLKFEITEISDRWHQYQTDSEWPGADYFKVITKDQKTFILKHETTSNRWFLIINKESIQFNDL